MPAALLSLRVNILYLGSVVFVAQKTGAAGSAILRDCADLLRTSRTCLDETALGFCAVPGVCLELAAVLRVGGRGNKTCKYCTLPREKKKLDETKLVGTFFFQRVVFFYWTLCVPK